MPTVRKKIIDIPKRLPQQVSISPTSSPRAIDRKIVSSGNRCGRLTIPYVDREGRQTCLCVASNGIVFAKVIDKNGLETNIDENSIRNAYDPQENIKTLVARIGGLTKLPKNLVLLLRGDLVYALPPLEGAGRSPEEPRVCGIDDFEKQKESGYGSRLYRPNLIKETYDAGREFHAHHACPKKFEGWFASKGINIHHWINVSWHSAGPHLREASQYNARWEAFIATNFDASPGDILQFAAQLAKEYNYQLGSYADSGLCAKIQTNIYGSLVQSTGLTSTVNGTNPSDPVLPHVAQPGQIGGVGISVGKIQGLKDTVADLLETDPVFIMACPDGKPPFL